jgi:hypothetical protein
MAVRFLSHGRRMIQKVVTVTTAMMAGKDRSTNRSATSLVVAGAKAVSSVYR